MSSSSGHPKHALLLSYIHYWQQLQVPCGIRVRNTTYKLLVCFGHAHRTAAPDRAVAFDSD